MFLLLDSAAWTGITALFTAFAALCTAALTVVAYRQLTLFRDENTKARTLAAIERYDFDPILNKAIRNVRNVMARNSARKSIEANRHDLISVMNYFEGLGIGVQEGVYDEKLIFFMLENPFHEFTEDLVDSGIAKKLGAPPDRFSAMSYLSKQWLANGGPPTNWPKTDYDPR
jgi:hypothetical protein